MKSDEVQRWASTLDAVVVYAQGALCTRVAGGTVPEGGRVRVTGLPRSMDPGSLRAKVVGDSGVRVTEVRVEVDAEPSDTDTADSLRHEMERLRDAYAAVEGHRDRQLSRIAEVAALRPVPPGRKREDPPRRTPADAWLRLADFVDERLRGLHQRLAELEEELRRAQHELSIATDRWYSASTAAQSGPVDTTVGALLTLDGSGPVELEIEYGVPGAVWVPAYRLTHRQDDDSGTLVLRASVAQRTGEDWTGVRIALATADLRRRTDLPRLRSIRVGRRQPAPAPSGWREPPAGLSDLFSGYDAAGPRPASTAMPVAVGAAGAGSAPLPPPPPPPPGQAYGMAAPAAPDEPGFGVAMEEDFDEAMPAMAPPPQSGRPRRASPAADKRVAAPASFAPAAPGMSAPPPAPPVVNGPPRPSGAELDYAALVLSGADEPEGRRGRLFPQVAYDPVAVEYRRRADAVSALPLPGHAVRPRESAGSFDHRFDAVARADIPSDGTWHTVTVTEIPVGLRTEYVCVPSVEQTVYATLVLSNATEQALLAGPVEVTVDEDFLLTAALPTLAPGGVRRMGLGPAEGVRVTRRTNLRESTAGLRGSTTVLDHQVHVELANRLAKAVTVEVHEQVPVTSEPDVRIEERADWTTPEQDSGPDRHAPGTRIWRVDLPAGSSAALDGGYEIRVPAAKALVGGNRRS
ncbi:MULTISPECIES: DUF4139 domain-containing protein [Streptomyces]|uniref:DUF4139 domain-containing protein n=1 Tax=Streptomyces spinosisporus TaxID=2927582 RepID=A0ABS9XI39_9ACTN|nr:MULTISPECIES: DUF4139 domain-containing protein [Streptomyces]MCI3241668.1 DUF4139 domain-containing protein [Streptomyces spinosisporus]WUB33692.1 DUF4139 domain-containing protein [Streptomyces sp. NBC_00588]